MTGHSIVGPALMKWHSCEMVVAWCAGRGEKVRRRGGGEGGEGGEVVWWGCVAGSAE